jgi:hypothetical protein
MLPAAVSWTIQKVMKVVSTTEMDRRPDKMRQILREFLNIGPPARLART